LHELPLWRRALRLLYYQHIYSAVLTAALIFGVKTASGTALVIGFIVGAIAYARLQRPAFSPTVDRRELLLVVGAATVAFYVVLTVFMLVTQPEALTNVANSPAALRMMARVYAGYPAMTLVGLGLGLNGVRRG
jgi:hypothetical protein